MSHLPWCQWESGRRWCACHQPTVWGLGYTYLCDCCEQPRAHKVNALCEDCAHHQDEPIGSIDIAHRSMDEHDGFFPPSGAGGGRFFVSGGL